MKTIKIGFAHILIISLIGLIVIDIIYMILPLIKQILGAIIIISFIMWILFETELFKNKSKYRSSTYKIHVNHKTINKVKKMIPKNTKFLK